MEALPAEKEKYQVVYFNSSSIGEETGGTSDSSYRPAKRSKRGPEESTEPRRSNRLKSTGVSRESVQPIDENLMVDSRKTSRGTAFAMGKWRNESCTVIYAKNNDSLCDIVSALLALEDLQGFEVPKMLAYGLHGGKPVLVVEPLDKVSDCRSLSHNEKHQLMRSVQAIHRAGYAFSEPIGSECIWKSRRENQPNSGPQ